MRRFLAILIVSALTSTSGIASLLHTHAYTGHDHPEHHHGIAAHDHHRAMPAAEDAAVHLEGCDPANHTLALSFVSSVPRASDALVAEAVVAPPLALPAGIEPARRAEVRVHGPPDGGDASPRAPPAVTLA